MDVSEWLMKMGFQDYIDEFEANGVDEEILLELTNEDLKDLGVSRLADRKRILKAIAQLGSKSLIVTKKTDPPAHSGERRHVTVLFADLAGFTSLSTELDPEELHNLLTRFYEAVDPVIEQYGGSVDKHLGDGIMALFGAPIAHGDDPLRALRTAFDIHEAMKLLSLEEGRELAVHIGIALGEVIAGGLGREGHKEYTVIGESVNLASRLDSLADTGETMIDPCVYGAVQDHVYCQDVGPTNIKGLSQPVNVWKACRLLEETGIKKTTFVGRRTELRQVEGVFLSCLEENSGQVIFIRGEAGIGKSRFLEEVEKKSASMGYCSYKTLVLDFGVSKGKGAIATLLNAINILDVKLLSGLAKDQEPFLRDLLGQDQLSADAQVYKNLDSQQRQKGKLAVINKILQIRATQTPTVLIIEDVHWADQTTLDYLFHIVSAITNLAITLVISTRVEGDPIGASWRNSSTQCPIVTLDLGPLKDKEINEFAKDFDAGQNTSFAKCIERAQGNPLFLEQLFKNVTEANDQNIPASIQSLILSRADRLPTRDKEALQAASVIGQRFDMEVVQHLIGNEDYDGHTLIQHQMIRPIANEYIFSHALLQESIYLSLLKKHRNQFHLNAATYYDSRDKLLHAEHLGRGEHPAASKAYLDAALHLIQQYKFDHALPALEKGLNVASTDLDHYHLIKHKALTLRELGQVQESIDTFTETLSLAPTPIDKAHIWIEIATGLRISDLHTEALEALTTASKLIEETDDIKTHASIHHMRGNIYFPMGRIDECTSEHEQSLRLAQESGSVTLQANALSGMADAHYMSGKMASAHRDFSRCVEVAEQAGLRNIAAANRSMVGFSRFYSLELSQALEDATQTIQEAKSIFFQRAELLGDAISVCVNFELADFEQATKHNQRAIELADLLGAPRFEAQALMYEGRIECNLGNIEKANSALNKALQISEEIGHGFAGPRIMASIAQCAFDEQHMMEALNDGEKMIENGSVGHNPLYFYPMAIELCLQKQRGDLVEVYCSKLEEYSQREPLPWSDFFIQLGQSNMEKNASQLDALIARATKLNLNRVVSLMHSLRENWN